MVTKLKQMVNDTYCRQRKIALNKAIGINVIQPSKKKFKYKKKYHKN